MSNPEPKQQHLESLSDRMETAKAKFFSLEKEQDVESQKKYNYWVGVFDGVNYAMELFRNTFMGNK